MFLRIALNHPILWNNLNTLKIFHRIASWPVNWIILVLFKGKKRCVYKSLSNWNCFTAKTKTCQVNMYGKTFICYAFLLKIRIQWIFNRFSIWDNFSEIILSISMTLTCFWNSNWAETIDFLFLIYAIYICDMINISPNSSLSMHYLFSHQFSIIILKSHWFHYCFSFTGFSNKSNAYINIKNDSIIGQFGQFSIGATTVQRRIYWPIV